ncbi:equilibrative nucleotide transporter 5-like isoform X1 [Glycine max]|uniref:equilibrative nucleotide transporter 5-like isoform X1 n=1 Tax=Glycine max TaxID=3847 RepID=UPI001B356C98|nr:equilibrative nucleotide transporter 5-like isoform X1 [Glycine max]
MVGDLSYMKLEFIQSFLAGVAASDALTSALRLITKTTFENSKDVLCKGAIIFPKIPIVKYYHSKAASEGSKTVSADLATRGIRTLPGAIMLFTFFFHSNKSQNFHCSRFNLEFIYEV